MTIRGYTLAWSWLWLGWKVTSGKVYTKADVVSVGVHPRPDGGAQVFSIQSRVRTWRTRWVVGPLVVMGPEVTDQQVAARPFWGRVLGVLPTWAVVLCLVAWCWVPFCLKLAAVR